MLNKKLQKNFTITDNRIMQNSQLSFEARGLYFYMISLPNGWEFSEARLAKNGGIGLDKCKRILKELFEIGLVKREFTHKKGYKKSIYTLFDFDTIENPSEKNPTLENPTLENPTLENPTNNKEIVTQIKKDNKERILTNNENLKNLDNLDIENSLEKENFLKKEKNIKKEKKTIFEQALELYQPNEYFTLDDWQEWIEYKQARCKNLTLQTFKQNFKFLLGLGVNARASINQSINHNWQGLFEVKQNQQQGQNQGYFKGLSAKEQFASVADNSYNPDDYDFSKLPVYS
jgi:hypothetical protein